MLNIPHILSAKGDDGLMKVIFIVAMIVLWAIGALVTAVKKAAEERKKRQRMMLEQGGYYRAQPAPPAYNMPPPPPPAPKQKRRRKQQPAPLRKPNVDPDVTGGIQTRGLSDTLRR